MKKIGKKTPNKAMPKGKKSSGGYTSAKGPKGKPKVTGKKRLPKARKSTIEQKLAKVKF